MLIVIDHRYSISYFLTFSQHVSYMSVHLAMTNMYIDVHMVKSEMQYNYKLQFHFVFNS